MCAKTPADILFALDTSTSIGSQNFEREKQFVLAFVADMDIGPSDVQVSVGTFSDNARRYFALNSHPNLHDLQAAIKRVSMTISKRSTLYICKRLIWLIGSLLFLIEYLNKQKALFTMHRMVLKHS